MGFKRNILAFFVISALGTLGHFVYGWTGENMLAGLIFPVNESIWEHLKLIYFPSVIYFSAEYFLTYKKPCNYIPAAMTGIFCGMASVVIMYYTISGIIGKNIDFINILIFFVAIIITISKRNKIISDGLEFSKNQILILSTAFIITAALFMIWSYLAPRLAIFTPLA